MRRSRPCFQPKPSSPIPSGLANPAIRAATTPTRTISIPTCLRCLCDIEPEDYALPLARLDRRRHGFPFRCSRTLRYTRRRLRPVALETSPALIPASEARSMAALSRPTAASSSRFACRSSCSEAATFKQVKGEGGSEWHQFCDSCASSISDRTPSAVRAAGVIAAFRSSARAAVWAAAAPRRIPQTA
jgi:hypothetical protein